MTGEGQGHIDVPQHGTVILMTARMKQFQHTVEKGLPQLFDDHALDASARAALTRYATELQDWMVGIMNWHEECGRYRDVDLERHFGVASFHGPTGLGTSAARLAR